MAEAPSERTRVHRRPERGVYDRETVDAVLDEALIGHLAWVTPEGDPEPAPDLSPSIEPPEYVAGHRRPGAIE